MTLFTPFSQRLLSRYHIEVLSDVPHSTTPVATQCRCLIRLLLGAVDLASAWFILVTINRDPASQVSIPAGPHGSQEKRETSRGSHTSGSGLSSGLERIVILR